MTMGTTMAAHDEHERTDADEHTDNDDEDAAGVVVKLEGTPSVADEINDAEDVRLRDEADEEYANTSEESEHEDEDPEEYRATRPHGLLRSEYELVRTYTCQSVHAYADVATAP